MMPGIVRGRNTGKVALALLLVDLESSGEHWWTTFFTEDGLIPKGDWKMSDKEKEVLRTNYIPYDYWYTPKVENDIHIELTFMPEEVIAIRKLVDEQNLGKEQMGMEPLL